MSFDLSELEPGDYHLAVRRREHSETPWRREIWAAGKTKPVQHLKQHFPSMSEASKEGKAALEIFVREKFPNAA